MAERLKQTIIEKEPAVDLIAGPDAYRNLPQMLATMASGQAAGKSFAKLFNESIKTWVFFRFFCLQ